MAVCSTWNGMLNLYLPAYALWATALSVYVKKIGLHVPYACAVDTYVYIYAGRSENVRLLHGYALFRTTISNVLLTCTALSLRLLTTVNRCCTDIYSLVRCDVPTLLILLS